MSTTDILTCTFISGEDSENKGRKPDLAKRCCPACAWKAEQMLQIQLLKKQTSTTDKILQNVANKILPLPSLDDGQGLVKKVKGPLTERQIRYASILSHAIQCRTVSHDDPSLNLEKKSELLKLHKLLQATFITLYQEYPPEIVNDFSLVFKIPGEEKDKKPIMLCAHLDVVPASPNNADNEWEHDPFGGEIIDGIIWGRGAIDNKHNVVGQLGAIEEILASGNLPKRTTYIAMGHDEEISGVEGAQEIAKKLEEENTQFEFILDEGTMCVAGAIPGYKEPVALIGCAEKGFMNVELTVTGKGGHSSMPPLNEDSPLKIMSKAIVKLESYPIPAHFERNSLFRTTLEYISKKAAFPFNIIFSNFWLFGKLFRYILLHASSGAAASIRTTTAVTKMYGGEKLNALPSEVKAYVNHRVHPSDTFESVLEHDRKVINDDRVKLKIMDASTPASPVSNHEKSTGFEVIRTSVENIFGFICAPNLCVGNTDTRWYWNLSENIFRFSPVALTMKEVSMFHGFNERIGVDALTNMVDFYKEILMECEDS